MDFAPALSFESLALVLERLSALATVERIETTLNGTPCVSIRYHYPKQSQRGNVYRSHLWEVDLGRVEAVIPGTQPSRHTRRNRAATSRRIQLRLPFEGDEENA
jgi:hypothetical protein